MTRGPRRIVALALAALAVSSVSAGASAAPPRAREAVLTTGTRIEWTGVTGMRLTFPREVRLPNYAARLTVRGGTYASVWWAKSVRCFDGKPCGASGWIQYSHDLARHFYDGYAPGTGHFSVVTNHGRLSAGVWDLYLLTDGKATLVFDDTGLPKKERAWTAAGRVKGSFQRLPTTCGYSQCTARDGYAGRARTGGAYGDVGRLGQAHMFVAHYSRHAVPVPNTHHARGCAYLQGPGHTGDPVRDYPAGCEVVTTTEWPWPYNYAASGNPIDTGMIRTHGTYAVSGRVYLGFVVSNAHDVSLPMSEAWGVWYEFGIR